MNSYFRTFPRDSRWIKYIVLVASVLSLYVTRSSAASVTDFPASRLKLVQTFLIVWDKNVIGFGDWLHAADVPWNVWIEPTAAAILALPAQVFFIWRCFELTSRNWWLLGLLFASTFHCVRTELCLFIPSLP